MPPYNIPYAKIRQQSAVPSANKITAKSLEKKALATCDGGNSISKNVQNAIRQKPISKKFIKCG